MELQKGCIWIVIGTMLLLTGSILPQQSNANPPHARSSFPVGVWESVQADGSSIGIDLDQMAEPFPGGHLAQGSTPPKVVFQVGVFQKQHQRIACGEENFFIVGEKDPNHDAVSSYSLGKLEIRYHDHVSGSEIQLSLVLDPVTDIWKGHFQRKFLDQHFQRQSFDGEVVLHRTSRQPDPTQGGCFTGGSKP